MAVAKFSWRELSCCDAPVSLASTAERLQYLSILVRTVIKRNFASLELASVTPLYHQTRVKESPAEQIRDQWEDLRQCCLNLMRPAHNSLEVSETLLTVKKGKSSQVDIDMTNNTSHEIVLRGWTLLGRLQRA